MTCLLASVQATGHAFLPNLLTSSLYFAEASFSLKLEDHVRDVRGEINKEMKKAVRLAYGGRVVPKDSEVTSVPSRTEQDRKMAENLLTGRSLPHGI